MAPRRLTQVVPRSATPGIVWPAVPDRRQADLLALLYQFEHSQWWPADQLRAQQARQLSGLLTHALRAVPFYGERLRAAGVRPDGPLGPDLWARIPLLSREDIQSAGSALHAADLPARHRPLGTVATSGSTGKPVKALTTALTRLFWQMFTVRDHLWHRRDLGAKLAVVRSLTDGQGLYPNGVRRRGWGGATGAVFATGPSVALAITATVEEQVEWLQRERPAYLLSYPPNLLALAQHCLDNRLSLPGLREVRTLGEVVSPEVRAAVHEAWGVRLADVYSAQEVGYMALQCPEHEHYHVQGEGALVEVLDARGEPCLPGTVGRVVVTPLHNLAMPLIRYDIGDYAEVGESCPCGRGLPTLTGILGRGRNMLRLPGGGRLWPRLSEARYVEFPAIRQFQLVQKSLERLEMLLVVERPLSPDGEARLREIILARIGHPFELVFTYVDAVPRGPAGKFEDFRSEVANP